MNARLTLFASLALCGAPVALAQTWEGDSGPNWSTANNWNPAGVPANGAATALVFPGTALSFTPNVDIGWTLNSMSITSPGYSFSGQPLNFAGTNPTLTVGHPGSSIANLLSLPGPSDFTLDNTTSFTLSGGMIGNGALVKTGAGTLTITGTNWHNGSTTVTAGTLNVGNGVAGPNQVNAIVNAAAVVFDTPVVSMAGVMTGSGSVTIVASSDVNMGGAGQFAHQGATTVHGLLNGNPVTTAINGNGPLVIASGGEVRVQNGTVGSLSGSGNLSVQTSLTAGGDDSSTTFTGLVNGVGEFRKVGAGTFTVASPFWFSSETTVEAPGILRFGNGTAGPGNVGALVANGTFAFDLNTSIGGAVTGSGNIRVESGRSVTHNHPSPFTHQGSTTINGTLHATTPVMSIDSNGPLVIAAGGAFNTRSATVGSLAGAGILFVQSGIFSSGGNNASTTFTGMFSGPGQFRKTGSGTLTMATNNWTSGATTVEPTGTLRIGNGTIGPFSMGALVVNGAVVIDSPNLTIGGPVTGTGTVRVEAGRTVSNGAVTPFSHVGSTTLNGTLTATTPAGSIDNNAPLVIGPVGSLATRSGTVGSLSGSGGLDIQSGLFTVGGDNSSTTFSGAISGVGDFRKIGAGSLTVATSSWFGGGVTVEAPGSLRIGNGSVGPTTAHALTVFGTLIFNTPNVNVNGPISGGGNVIVQSGSTVTMTSGVPMTHDGPTIVSGGLMTGPSFAIDNNSALLLSGIMSVQGGTVGSFSGSGSLQLNGGTFTTGGNNVASTFSGPLSGSGTFTKTGINTLTLSGPSPAFNAFVQVNSGTLHVSGNLGTSGLSVATGAFLTGTGSITGPVSVDPSADVAPGPTIATLGTGNLALAGTLRIEVLGPAPGTLHDRLSVTGTVALNGGTLSLSGGYVPVAGNSFVIIDNDGADPVVGTFAGLPEGATFTFNGATLRITYAGGTGNDVVLSIAAFTVTPSAGPNGSINPNTPQAVAPGGTTTFTVTANSGFTASVGGTCGGNLVGTTYTTNAVNADCTVVANFVLTSYTVTPSAGTGGTITPPTPQSVAPGATATFTVTPNAGLTASVGGTCGGNLVGTTYTTNAINANCTVVASFATTTYTVTPSAGAGGNINPSTPQTIAQGATTTFTVTPNAGFAASVGGTCGGNLAGTTYTTNAINADCTVVASFTAANYTVTPSAGANGGISPSVPQSVAHGSTTSFSVSPAPGYVATVGGTCGGTLAGTTYQTNPITANCTVSATFTSADPARLFNIATRGQVITGNDVMIGGFIIGGSASKTVVVRARGPSLVPLGLANALPDPELRLFSGQTVIGYNNNWQDASNAAQVQASGYVPPDPLESALLVTLAPGPYTAIVSGVGGATGIGIIEVFEVDNPSSPLVNIATRGRVGISNNVLIAGLIIQGTGPQQVVVRARGPSLTPLGVTGALADPQLSLSQSSDGTVLGVNDNWGSASNAAALQASGFAPSDPAEAALLVTLHPGAYTVVVSGAGNTSGVAIVEVFAVP